MTLCCKDFLLVSLSTRKPCFCVVVRALRLNDAKQLFVFVIGQYFQCGFCQELTPALNAVQVIYWYKAMLTSGYQGFKGDRHNVVCRVDYLVTNISNWQLHWRWGLESRSWIKAASYRCNFQTVGNVMFAFKVIWSLPVQNSTSAFGRSL